MLGMHMNLHFMKRGSCYSPKAEYEKNTTSSFKIFKLKSTHFIQSLKCIDKIVTVEIKHAQVSQYG